MVITDESGNKVANMAYWNAAQETCLKRVSDTH